MPSIVDLFVTVSSDVGGAITGLAQVDQRVNGTSAAMAAAAPAGYALAAAAGAVGAGFVTAIGEATSFEQRMSGVRAVLAPTEVNIYGAALTELALTLGRDTVFSANQAAGAIEELVRAGVDVDTVLRGGASAALSLAAATGIDVREAATFAGIALNTFHQDADQLTHTVDTLAGVTNASAADMGDLRLAFASVGPVAASLGLSMDDSAIALGIFADNGLRGSDAGTSLRTMLLNLQPSTERQTQAMRDLGIITADGTNQFFTAAGAARPMNEIFQVLQDTTRDLTQQQRIHALETIFGTDAVRGATIAATEGADGFNQLSAAVGQISAADAARVRLDNLAGSLNQMGGSFETIQITIGTLFLPVLRSIVDAATGVLNAFLTLDPSIQVTIVTIIGIAGAVTGLVAAFVLLSPMLTAMGAAFGIIFAAAAPIAVPLLAIAAAAAALYLAWQTNFGGIRDVTAQVMEAIQPGLVNIQNFVSALGAELGPAFSGVATAAQPFIQALSNLLAPILAQIPGMVRSVGDAFNLLGPPLQSIFEIIRMLATGDFRGGIFGLDEDAGLVTFFLTLHDAIRLFFDAALRLLQGDFSGAWNSLWGSFTTVLGGVATAIPQIFDTLRGIIGNFLQALPGWVAQNVPGMWQALLDEIGRLAGLAGPYWDNFANWLGSVVSGIPQFVANNMGFVWQGLVTAFSDLVPSLAPYWDNFAGWLGSVLGGIPQFVADNMGFVWQALATAFNDLVTVLAPFWDNFAAWFGSILGYLPQFVGDTMGFVWGALVTAFNDLVPVLQPYWDNFASWLGQTLGYLPQFVADVSGDVFGWIVEQAGALVQRMQDALGPLAQWLAETFGNFWNWLVSGGTVPTAPPADGGGGTGGGGIGTGGPIVSVGTLIISSQEEANAFLNLVAQAVLASARRVSPPVSGTNPAL